MKCLLRNFVFIGLMLTACTVSCASTKTLHVWKDEGYNQRLRKVLIVAIAELDYMRDHFENVLAGRFAARGVDAVPSNKVIPHQTGLKLDREVIAAKVRELGIESVLVVRAVSKDEVSQFFPGEVYSVPAGYYEGWYSFYSESIAFLSVPSSAYDAEFFTMVTHVYDVHSDKLIWSYLSRVKVEESRQGAINPFIDTVMRQLEDSKLL